MRTRIMLAGDLHKRSKDITTIEGYVRCTQAVQRKLMDIIEELEVDKFISLGDWYDKGYAVDVSASLSDYDADIEMSKKLDGAFYGLIGNHIRLNMDSNPELHIIQPHPVYKSRRATERVEQVMKTPNMLRIGNVQISFMHHVQGVTDVLAYHPKRESWAAYHIALFHTPLIIPYNKLVGTGYEYGSSPNDKIAQTLSGVDLAIVGDIHKPIGKFQHGNTTMIVPGSLTNTDAGDASRHSIIEIPVIDVEDDKVSLSFYTFDLMTNMLTFKKKNVERSKEALKTLRGKAVPELHTDRVNQVASVISNDLICTSLNAFMQSQGYTSVDKAIVQKVISAPEDIDGLINIYKGER